MVAKLLLPFWGGSPAVWNTCLVFFQGTLLLGYAYAHWLAGRRLLWQGIAQAGLLGLSALFLPIALPEILIAPTDAPILALLGVLVGLVGLPFFVVSTTAPLIQRWFADAAIATHPDPYFLYAASNLGSLLGLLSYPLLIEPNVALPQQKLAWAIAFGVLAVSMVACLVWSGRSRLSTPTLETFEAEKTREALVSLEAAPTWGDRALWIALSFLPSSLFRTYALPTKNPVFGRFLGARSAPKNRPTA